VATNVAFLYSFSGNSWSQTGSMKYARFNQTMTLLPSGEVLVVGGNSGTVTSSSALNSAELSRRSSVASSIDSAKKGGL
jgi:hypothetical protein